MKDKNSKIYCIFCGRSEGQVPLMIKSELGLQGVCIDCANALNDIAREQKNKQSKNRGLWKRNILPSRAHGSTT